MHKQNHILLALNLKQNILLFSPYWLILSLIRLSSMDCKTLKFVHVKFETVI